MNYMSVLRHSVMAEVRNIKRHIFSKRQLKLILCMVYFIH
jgi:hypothetical protein